MDPPVVRLFPAKSFACNVRLILEPEATDELETLINEVEVEIIPGLTSTVGRLVVTATPPMVAPMVVAVPASTPVKTAV